MVDSYLSRARRAAFAVGLVFMTALGAAPAQALNIPPAPERPHLEALYEAVIHIGPTRSLGHGPNGERRVMPITGGTFKGERLEGEIKAGGGDRQLIRPNGTREQETSYEMKTVDGVTIKVRNETVVHDDLTGSAPYAMSYIHLSVPAGRYAWLNNYVVVGTLTPIPDEPRSMLLNAYRVMP
ncbi:DUF3237 domain-containing protein [Larsenimonas rhizosphaerae]|uniref:DUF3237 domain-containing protein n=1 Tax=Larsenimonas rhizosphaerae TaxID=2944682 RepID=UPI0020338E3E|nr:DUF3237 domain-containing protein [Larsenimonas rhizosphaerae]